MDEEYDVIVRGTGLKECILSGVLSVDGKKVLHMDRNSYYGGESASLNLEQAFEKFHPGTRPAESLGRSRDYNIDLVPKFIMATGLLTKMLIHTNVTRYLEFRGVAGSYVARPDKIHKVPVTEREALGSGLMGFFEKRRCGKFLNFVQDYDQTKPSTFKDVGDCSRLPMRAVFEKFGVDAETQEFIGHALALYTDNDYIEKPALETVNRIVLYKESLVQYTGKSPYIYPRYGLGELPQAFARHSAVYGGTYMLNKPIDEIVYDAEGVAIGVRSEGEVARGKIIIGDPSYFLDKVREDGRVVRMICILNHPIPKTDHSDSLQIILPAGQFRRKNDIYVMCIAADHSVASAGKFIAIASTHVETDNPERELQPALEIIGDAEARFLSVSPMYVPTSDGTRDKCFISQSYDSTSHFESTSADVMDIYQRITGHAMDLSPPPENPEESS